MPLTDDFINERKNNINGENKHRIVETKLYPKTFLLTFSQKLVIF